MNPPEKKRKLSNITSENEDESRKVARNLFADSMNRGFFERENLAGTSMSSKFDGSQELHSHHGKQPLHLTSGEASLRSNYDELRFAPAGSGDTLDTTRSSLNEGQLPTPDRYRETVPSSLAINNLFVAPAERLMLASQVSDGQEDEDEDAITGSWSNEEDDTIMYQDSSSSSTISESSVSYHEAKGTHTDNPSAEAGYITVEIGKWKCVVERAELYGRAMVIQQRTRDLMAEESVFLVKEVDRVHKRNLQIYESRILSLESQLANRDNTIAYLHTQLGTYDEKDDAWFVQRFTNIHSSIRHWLIQHFKGVTKISKRIYQRSSWYLFQDDANSERYQKPELRKEIFCLLHAYIVFLIQARIFDIPHCGLSEENQVELRNIDSLIADEPERTKWRSKTLRLMLPCNKKMDEINIVKERISRLVTDLENMIGAYASPSSSTTSRQYGLGKIAFEAVHIAHENRMRSSAEFNLVWPRPGQQFDQERMDIFGTYRNAEYIDGTEAVIEGTLFPEIVKTSIEEDGFRNTTTVRNAYVCLAKPVSVSISTEITEYTPELEPVESEHCSPVAPMLPPLPATGLSSSSCATDNKVRQPDSSYRSYKDYLLPLSSGSEHNNSSAQQNMQDKSLSDFASNARGLGGLYQWTGELSMFVTVDRPCDADGDISMGRITDTDDNLAFGGDD